MTADEFAERLKELAPTEDELAERGMTPSGIRRLRQCYFCKRLRSQDELDPLVDLCKNFDVSTLEVAGFRFCPLTNFDSEHWQVGLRECDPVIIPKAGGVVSIRDHEDLAREVAKCASSSAGFLAGLIEVERFILDTMSELEKRVRGELRFQVLEKCLELAGGSQYKQFWSGVLGIGPGPAFWQKVWKVLWKDVW